MIDHSIENIYNAFMFMQEVYKKRRQAFLKAIRDRGITRGTVLLLANSHCPRNYPDNCYPFRQDSSWLYLIGLNIPDLACTLDIESEESCLYAEELGLEEIIWTGELPSPVDQAYSVGIEKVLPTSYLSNNVEQTLKLREPVFILPPYQDRKIAQLSEIFGTARSSLEELIYRYIDPRVIMALVSVREIKEPEELAEIERAVSITKNIHEELLHQLKVGWTEKDAAGFVLSRASAQGCELSFATVATCRASVLHNSPTEHIATAHDTFLLDAGVETPLGYAGDLTTTFPVGPSFSHQSKEIYQVLCESFRTATNALAPGVRFLDVHKKASLTITKGLISLGLMKGDPVEAVESGAHALFFPHGLGHQIGLDVHDMEGLGEDYVGYGEELKRSEQFGLRSLRLAKTLKPGMVHSVEPGIYFIPQLVQKWRTERICENFLNYDIIEKWMPVGGMRIEEDWCIIDKGARRLGPAFDKSIEAIENVRANR